MNRYYTTEPQFRKHNLLLKEVRCHVDGDLSKPCPDCGGEAKLLEETAWAFDDVRQALGEPINVSSAHRCTKKQARLFKAAVAKYGSEAEAAKHVARPSSNGPHERSTALDLLTPGSFDTPADWARFVWSTLGGNCRLGVYPWGVHLDRAYLLNPNPDKRNYVKGITWGLPFRK